MPVALVPIDHAASILRIDLHVLGTAHRAAVFDSSRPDAQETEIVHAPDTFSQ